MARVDCACWQSRSSFWCREAENLGDTNHENHNGIGIRKDDIDKTEEAFPQRMKWVMEMLWFAEEKNLEHMWGGCGEKQMICGMDNVERCWDQLLCKGSRNFVQIDAMIECIAPRLMAEDITEEGKKMLRILLMGREIILIVLEMVDTIPCGYFFFIPLEPKLVVVHIHPLWHTMVLNILIVEPNILDRKQ